jgi:putative aldouronate transport system permease protein
MTRKITLPLLSPLITVLFLLMLGKMFYSDFGQFYIATKDTGTLYSTTDVIDTYVYRTMRVTSNNGMASAAGLFQSALGFITVMASNFIVKLINDDNSLF